MKRMKTRLVIVSGTVLTAIPALSLIVSSLRGTGGGSYCC